MTTPRNSAPISKPIAWRNAMVMPALGCTIHAALYVVGRRSLTPVCLAHGIYNVFGEPYLLMMAMAAMPR